MAGDPDPYLELITSEHSIRPRYLATVRETIQPLADVIALEQSLPSIFDLDVAIGAQLDVVGQWVGRTRYLTTVLSVFFSWGIVGLGWGEGVWKQPFDPDSGVVVLPDEQYRTLLRATIAANNWDGTIPGAYLAWNTLFAGTGFEILIQDYGDMTMAVGLVGSVPDALTLALFTTGELDLKPAGVRIADHFVPSVYGVPVFGWGVENATIAGWGTGAWVNDFAPE